MTLHSVNLRQGLMDLATVENERDYTPNIPGIYERPVE